MNLQALLTSLGALTDAMQAPTNAQRNVAPTIQETNLVKID